jgi:hypothetical protein
MTRFVRIIFYLLQSDQLCILPDCTEQLFLIRKKVSGTHFIARGGSNGPFIARGCSNGLYAVQRVSAGPFTARGGSNGPFIARGCSKSLLNRDTPEVVGQELSHRSKLSTRKIAGKELAMFFGLWAPIIICCLHCLQPMQCKKQLQRQTIQSSCPRFVNDERTIIIVIFSEKEIFSQRMVNYSKSSNQTPALSRCECFGKQRSAIDLNVSGAGNAF